MHLYPKTKTQQQTEGTRKHMKLLYCPVQIQSISISADSIFNSVCQCIRRVHKTAFLVNALFKVAFCNDCYSYSFPEINVFSPQQYYRLKWFCSYLIKLASNFFFSLVRSEVKHSGGMFLDNNYFSVFLNYRIIYNILLFFVLCVVNIFSQLTHVFKFSYGDSFICSL